MREELTNEELIQLYDAATSGVNAQFELWITITFAVIIASYLAGHRLARSLQYMALQDNSWVRTWRILSQMSIVFKITRSIRVTHRYALRNKRRSKAVDNPRNMRHGVC